MAYTKNTPAWATGDPDATNSANDALGALVSAARLNHMEDGLEAAAEVADAAQAGLASKANSSTVAGKADQSDLDALEAVVQGKADASAIPDVSGFQDATEVDAAIDAKLADYPTTSAMNAAISTATADLATQSALDALEARVAVLEGA